MGVRVGAQERECECVCEFECECEWDCVIASESEERVQHREDAPHLMGRSRVRGRV